ncbi:putative ubiA prenyltransferase family [Heracleum sosnowskyi]|uniref:UbiA prenyltransferase family n=1 Tax=Heracleum sosnowskyi TaxID=360622 RepID=A0AAD8MNH5_9APIA|nr:putative ubiA prenyltransferase family [Heracleum sosnowskyi]
MLCYINTPVHEDQLLNTNTSAEAENQDMIQTEILREGNSLQKRRRDRNQLGETFGATLEGELALQSKDDNQKVSIQSDLQTKWDVFYRFCRLHSVTGTVTGVISVSLLPLTSFSDLSPAFFVGLLKAVIPFAFVNIYVVTLNQLIDVGIDKINKPYLVLAAGEYTMRQGKVITSAFGIMCLVLPIIFQSPPLLYGVIIHFLVGTAYSVELPLLRWKTKPLLAALSIGLHDCMHSIFSFLSSVTFRNMCSVDH